MIKKVSKLLTLTISLFVLFSSTVFAFEHHTSWNGDRNTPFEFVNNNIPYFTEEEKQRVDSFEIYSPLDGLGRVTVCYANIGQDLMPKKGEKRGKIDSVTPSGWKYNGKPNNKKYIGVVEAGWLYNRAHMIGWQLTAENANKKNLFTGTRFINVNGQLPFENDVAEYIKTTGNHVLYRVTAIYEGSNLIPEGVRMEGWSVEDKGHGICFNVFCYNVQPGIEINYLTGENSDKSYQESPSSTYSNNNSSDNKNNEIKSQVIVDNSNSIAEKPYDKYGIILIFILLWFIFGSSGSSNNSSGNRRNSTRKR